MHEMMHPLPDHHCIHLRLITFRASGQEKKNFFEGGGGPDPSRMKCNPEGERLSKVNEHATGMKKGALNKNKWCA